MKDTLIEIKNFQGIHSRVGEAEKMIWNRRKQKTTNQNSKKKKESKKK